MSESFNVDKFMNALAPSIENKIQVSTDEIFKMYGSQPVQIMRTKMMTYDLVLYAIAMHELLKRQNEHFFAISSKERSIENSQDQLMAMIEDDKRQKIILLSYLHALRFYTLQDIRDTDGMDAPFHAHDEVLLRCDAFLAQIPDGRFKQTYAEITSTVNEWCKDATTSHQWINFFIKSTLFGNLPTITEAIISPLSGNSNPYLVNL